MSDPRLNALSESARNRGLKLVRSRVRTPGKRRYGKVGLVDPSGEPVFGMDGKGPNQSPDAIEDYLRTLETHDWGASLGETDPPRSKPNRQPTNDWPEAAVHAKKSHVQREATKPRPILPPKPEIREARPSDAERLRELICELGHPMDVSQVKRNLGALKTTGETPLVATLGKRIVGLCGVGRRVVISRPAPLGRITSLIVTRDAQGHGIGRMLVEAAEAWMRKHGCQLVEVTSNDRRSQAHAFYRHMGYQRTSIRFAKPL